MKRFMRSLESLTIARRFWFALAHERVELLKVTLVGFVVIALTILRPWPIQWVFDGALMPRDGSTVDPSRAILFGAVGLALIGLSHGIASYFETVRRTEIGMKVTRALRLRVFSHVQSLPPAFHSKHKTGDLLVRLMGDVSMVKSMLVESGITLISRSILIVGTLAMMLLIDPVLVIAVVAPIPLLALVVRRSSAALTIAVRKQRRKESELADFLQESVDAAAEIQVMGGSAQTIRRFARSNRREARAGVKTARAAARLASRVEVLLAVSLAGALALGSYRVLNSPESLSPGELLVFLSYVRSLAKPVRSAAKQMTRVSKGVACGERLLRILDEAPAVQSPPNPIPLPTHPSELCFEHVSYSYADGMQALDDVSFSVQRGKLTALVGPSGAGKSTTVALALRSFDPTGGRVLIDGHDLREFDVDELRQQFAISLQNTVLFGESLRDNLLLGNDDEDDAKLLDALSAAGARGFVEALPEGLDAILGASGKGVSGGEGKRLCLARALLKDAPMMLVDEPFAGLDPESADHVLGTLRDHAREHIVIVVTHDVDKLAAFEDVICLDNGKCIGHGSHSALLQSNSAYAASCHAG